jgi:hypothetical protein
MARRYRPYREAAAGRFWWAGILAGLIVGALTLVFVVIAHKLASAVTGFLVAVVGGLALRRIRGLNWKVRRSR